MQQMFSQWLRQSIIDRMSHWDISANELARESGVSPSIIHGILYNDIRIIERVTLSQVDRILHYLPANVPNHE